MSQQEVKMARLAGASGKRDLSVSERKSTTTVQIRKAGRLRSRQMVQKLLSPAGIEINGDRPFDIRVLNDAFYDEALGRGTRGALDAYVEGWWESDRLDELTAKVVSSGLTLSASNALSLFFTSLSARLFHRQRRKGSRPAGKHYDLGNDLFEAMLDRRMVYSCACWKEAANLDEAQEAKLELVAQKVRLRPGMRVLDIGCGWGSFAAYAAQTHGVSVVGVTVSKEQYELGKTLCAGLPVDLRLADYREIDDEAFDAVVSLGMFEHVGRKNHRRFMKIARRCLRPDGLLLLQTVGANSPTWARDPWIERNIFPNYMLPTATQIAAAAENLMIIEDWENFGADYEKTLMAWFENFEANWSKLRHNYGDRFHRMWKCYLLICAGLFRARFNQVWQIVFSPSGVPGGYTCVR